MLSFTLFQLYYLLRTTLGDPNNSNHPNNTLHDAFCQWGHSFSGDLCVLQLNSFISSMKSEIYSVLLKLHLKLTVPLIMQKSSCLVTSHLFCHSLESNLATAFLQFALYFHQ